MIRPQRIINRAFVKFALRYYTKCQWCNKEFSKTNPATCDHIIPSSRYGDDDWDNLCLACLVCNQTHDDDDWSARRRFGPNYWEEFRCQLFQVPYKKTKTEPLQDTTTYVVWSSLTGSWKPVHRGRMRCCEREAVNLKRMFHKKCCILPEGQSPDETF